MYVLIGGHGAKSHRNPSSPNSFGIAKPIFLRASFAASDYIGVRFISVSDPFAITFQFS